MPSIPVARSPRSLLLQSRLAIMQRSIEIADAGLPLRNSVSEMAPVIMEPSTQR